jgi:glucose-1-phosphate cytidylyltransferase
VDIGRLVDFHEAHGKIASMTAVRPAARFGELSLDEDLVTEFKEKPQLQQGWINGGFFVMETKILDYIQDDTIMLEQEPLSAIVALGELMAFKHTGFWHCMDTKRDFDYLNKSWLQGAPWQKKD